MQLKDRIPQVKVIIARATVLWAQAARTIIPMVSAATINSQYSIVLPSKASADQSNNISIIITHGMLPVRQLLS